MTLQTTWTKSTETEYELISDYKLNGSVELMPGQKVQYEAIAVISGSAKRLGYFPTFELAKLAVELKVVQESSI